MTGILTSPKEQNMRTQFKPRTFQVFNNEVTMFSCPKTAQYRYPDNGQLNVSFPILMRTSPTSNMPAVPFSCEPNSAFSAGTMFSGRRGIAGKEFVFSLAESPSSLVVESVSRDSGTWVGGPCAGRSRRTQAKDAWKRGCS